jgi:hypothetical protein
MDYISEDYSSDVGDNLESKLDALARPGVVFSGPFREGNLTVITASEYIVLRNRAVARPVAVIIVRPNGVEVRPILNPARRLLLSFVTIVSIAWALVIMFHPPWKPNTSLLQEIQRIIQAERG